MFELNLNAEEQNKILQVAAEEAYKKQEVDKHNARSKSCTKRQCTQLQSKYERFVDHRVMNTSSQESEGTLKNISTCSSVNSEFQTNYYLPKYYKLEAPHRF